MDRNAVSGWPKGGYYIGKFYEITKKLTLLIEEGLETMVMDS